MGEASSDPEVRFLLFRAMHSPLTQKEEGMKRLIALLIAIGLVSVVPGFESETEAVRMDEIQYRVSHLYQDSSGQLIGQVEENCNGSLYSWGTSVGAVEHTTWQSPCFPGAMCHPQDGYSWYTIDGVGSYCLRAGLAETLQEHDCDVVPQ